MKSEKKHWTEDEENRLRHLFFQFDGSIKQILNFMPGRTPSSLRSKIKLMQLKKLEENENESNGESDSSTSSPQKSKRKKERKKEEKVESDSSPSPSPPPQKKKKGRKKKEKQIESDSPSSSSSIEKKRRKERKETKESEMKKQKKERDRDYLPLSEKKEKNHFDTNEEEKIKDPILSYSGSPPFWSYADGQIGIFWPRIPMNSYVVEMLDNGVILTVRPSITGHHSTEMATEVHGYMNEYLYNCELKIECVAQSGTVLETSSFVGARMPIKKMHRKIIKVGGYYQT